MICHVLLILTGDRSFPKKKKAKNKEWIRRWEQRGVGEELGRGEERETGWDVKLINNFKKSHLTGWRFSSVVERLPSKCKI